MKEARVSGGSLLGLAILLANTAAAQTYTAVDLGNLGQGAPAAINNSGQVAGTLETTNLHAFLYSNGTINDLGTLASSGTPYSNGYGINQAGEVVGESAVGSGTYHAFLYSDGSLIDLDSADYESAATGINSMGQIAGYAGSGPGSFFAALFSGGQAINLGAIAGSTSCQAQGINDNGQVVGFCDLGGGNSYHAFLYSRGNILDLGTLAGQVETLSSRANAINNRGQVVGFSDNAGGQSHAFVYSGGTMTDLGVLSGFSGSVATAINNLGQVVGIVIPSGSTAEHAFLYSGGTMTDLNSLVSLPGGAVLISANGINDAGQIAALGSDGHAYLLTYANSQLSVLNPFASYAVAQQTPRPLNIESMLTSPTAGQILAADGESALVLVYKSTSPQPVTFNISTPGTTLPSGSSAGSLGVFQATFLTAPQPTSRVTSLLVSKPTFGPDAQASYYFLALLWAPAAMPVPDATPAVQILATANQTGQPAGQARINLEPPPLLLVHGIWASAESADFTPGSGGFYDYIASRYPHNLIFPVDYGTMNDRSFADPGIQNIFLSAMQDALAAAAETGMAARTVDVAGHSTGGLVARYFISNPVSDPILLPEPVHKLITLGTPHSGTALASTLVNNAALTTTSGGEVAAWCEFISPCSLGDVMTALGKPPGAGAASMEPGSAALESLSSSNVFSAIAGASPSPISTTESLLDIAIGAFLPGSTVANILNSTNDTLATTASQDPPGAADSAPAIAGIVSSSLCSSCNQAETASPAAWAQAYYWLTGGTGAAPSGNGLADLSPEPRGARPKTSAGGAPLLNLTGYTQAASDVAFQPASGSTLTINTANSITATSATKTITEVLLLQT
ncbi:MAG TPA: hypothetical protein VMB03_15055, partial [Bryobacteraceae bacterium]|nr:hypothetical protein [Bryobacteraceae bacterium]